MSLTSVSAVSLVGVIRVLIVILVIMLTNWCLCVISVGCVFYSLNLCFVVLVRPSLGLLEKPICVLDVHSVTLTS